MTTALHNAGRIATAILIALAITFLIDAAFRTFLALPQIVAEAQTRQDM